MSLLELAKRIVTMRNRLYFIIMIMMLALLSACYQTPDHYYGEPHVNSVTLPDKTTDIKLPENETLAARRDEKPWEVFSLGYDLYGRPLQNRFLALGDEYFSQGLKNQAIGEYLKAETAGDILSPAEEEVAILRISAAELSQDRARESLAILSKYFAQEGRGVDTVKPPFSIVFGYAYGRSGDINQALAWLSRAFRTAAGNAKISTSARTGVDLILRSLSDEKLYDLPSQWLSDTFISGAIGRENRRRAETLTPHDGATNMLGSVGGAPDSATAATTTIQQPANIVALLPLTGPYGRLGTSSRNGISLVLDGRNDGITVNYLDTKGDAAQATRHINEMVVRREASVVIGPLLATPAAAAATVAAQNNIPMVALSKKSDFAAGGSVFRLGTTTPSQVMSLLEKTYATLGMTKYALIYPANENGFEYANIFKIIAGRMRLEVVYEASYHVADSASFMSVGQALQQLDVEGVFFPADIDSAVTFMQALPEQLRARIKLLGTPAWDDADKLARSKQLMNNAIFVTPFFMQDTDQLVQNFVTTYQRRFGSAPDFMAAQGFDVATLVVAALQKQRSTGMSFVQALQEIDHYNGVTGVIAYSGNGELFRKLAVIQYQNGTFVHLNKAQASPMYVGR